eukprot:scaffold10248_cov65-Phaeocystis_antarctica.AAC.13
MIWEAMIWKVATWEAAWALGRRLFRQFRLLTLPSALLAAFPLALPLALILEHVPAVGNVRVRLPKVVGAVLPRCHVAEEVTHEGGVLLGLDGPRPHVGQLEHRVEEALARQLGLALGVLQPILLGGLGGLGRIEVVDHRLVDLRADAHVVIVREHRALQLLRLHASLGARPPHLQHLEDLGRVAQLVSLGQVGFGVHVEVPLLPERHALLLALLYH